MSALSKRQQARNEKQLQELVQNVPGNNMCADCHARNPSWASWSLGVFLCMRCAAIHRKLGTHVSKVKSLSMDSWSNEQVDNMRKVGNVASNSIYNPENRKPPVPVDVDEADSAMERFIRQKYMDNNVAIDTSKLRNSKLDEGTPPPLPPKNSTKFGFRSASSIFPLSSRARKEAKMAAAAEAPRSPSPKPPNKPSKVFGASLDCDQPDDLDQKLARLREMGFQDNKRNTLVLKGVNGNMDRAIEALVRLGEGDGRHSPLPAVPQEQPHTLRTSRSLTPLTPGSGGLGLGAGLSVSKPSQDRPITPSSASTNPFDMMGPAPPQTAQSTGNLQTNNPYSPTNPFAAQSQRQNDPFGQAFQNMTLSPPHQPLFPNRTGGPAPLGAQQTGYQHQAPAPSAPASPQGHQPMNFVSSMTYPQPMQPQQTGYNPFFTNSTNPFPQQPQQQISQSALTLNTSQTQGAFGNNPFARSPTRMGSTSLGQIPEQMQTGFQTQAPIQPQHTATNPFFNSSVQSPAQMGQQAFNQQQLGQQQPYGQQALGQSPFGQQQLGQQYFGQQQYGQQQQQQQPQQLQAIPQQLQQPQYQQYYQPQRADNASIMALFGQPQLAPQKPTSPQSAQPTQPPNPTPSIPENQPFQATTAPVQQPQSTSQPFGGNNNPFLNNSAAAPAPKDPFAARSRESMNLGMDMAWTNGRHSPDAFASLSARHV